MTVFVILWVIAVLVVAGALVTLVTSWGGERQLPPPPPPPHEIRPVWQPPLPPQTQSQLPPQTQKRIQRRARHAEPPAPSDGTQKNIRLRGRIKKRKGTLNPNAKCRVTRRLVAECGCESCSKLRMKYGV